MRALVVLIMTMPFIMTIVRMVFIVRKIMPVIMVFVEIVIEPLILTGVTVNVFSGNIIGLGFVIRNLFRLPDFLPRFPLFVPKFCPPAHKGKKSRLTPKL
jgi:hypothetical protein